MRVVIINTSGHIEDLLNISPCGPTPKRIQDLTEDPSTVMLDGVLYYVVAMDKKEDVVTILVSGATRPFIL